MQILLYNPDNGVTQNYPMDLDGKRNAGEYDLEIDAMLSRLKRLNT